MTDIREQISQLADIEFNELKAWIVTTETDRRAALPAVKEAARETKEEVVAEVAERLAEKDVKLKPPAKAGDKPRPWKAWHPLDTTTHFYYGDLATNGGKTWRDVLDETRTQLNVWEPGSAGIDERYWVELTEDKPEPEGDAEATEPATPKVAEYKQPTGAHDAYNKGDRVAYKGATWESTIDANVWAPDTYPQGWKRI